MTHKKHEHKGEPASPNQRITPRALLEVKRLSDPQLHPDGVRIAFVVTEADFDESTMISHLWLAEHYVPEAEEEAEPDNAQPPEAEPATVETNETEKEEEEDDGTRQLTYSLEGEDTPRWSPDGRYLAFLSSRPNPEASSEDEDEDPTEQVWILPIEGGEARKITAAKEGVLTYHWMPDSSEIVYLAPEPRPKPLESVRKEDREHRKVDPTVENEERLRRQVWRIELDAKKPKLVFTGDLGVHDFALSPDGSRLCFATNYTGEDNDYHRTDLYLRAMENGANVKLVQRNGGKYHLRWAPDGKRIAFLSWHDPEISYSNETAYAAEVPGELPKEPLPYGPDAPGITEAVALTELDTDLLGFEWSHGENGGIYALAAVGTGGEIYHIGTETTRIELPEKAHRTGLAVHPEEDMLAWIAESATTMPEIFLNDSNGEVHQLTKINAEFTQTYRLPRQEVVTWNSPDGLPIEGVVVYPLDYEAGKRYPLIVQIHGGPKGRVANTLRNYYLSPVWSAEGYAVLLPNFRGSEGYGHAFAIANRRDLGGGDFADIMAGVDWCIEAGFVAAEQLGVMGGSYGGYMTNWAIGHTDRFRAAVSMFGIFHLQTDYSNSELSRWDNEYTGAYYWEDPEIYRRLSPGSYIEAIKTPTLILHGDEDSNTFISNSKELYQALRHRGIVTQFVHYPREGHGLSEPNHKLDEIRRCLAWMDRYVRHGGEAPGIYRLHDKIPDAAGRLELSVTRAEITTFPGWDDAVSDAQTALFEIAFAVHQKDTRETIASVALPLDALRLEVAGETEPRLPLGVPLDVPGGKVLLEGENLRIAQRPDPDNGQLAFGGAAVFRVAKSGGTGQLRIGDFPPVAVAWSGGED